MKQRESDSPERDLQPRNNRLITQFLRPPTEIASNVIRKRVMLEDSKLAVRGRLEVLEGCEKTATEAMGERGRTIDGWKSLVDRLPREIDAIKGYALQVAREVRVMGRLERQRRLTFERMQLGAANQDGPQIVVLKKLLGELGQPGGPLLSSLRKEKESELEELMRKKVRLGAEEFLSREEEDCKAMACGWAVWAGEYQPIQLIGRGGSSQVYKCFSLKTMTYQALKLHNQNESWSQQQRQTFMKHIEREYHTHSQLQHPNILKLNDFCVEQDKTFIVMELCKGYDLAFHIKQRGRIDIPEALDITLQIVQALCYLSSQDPIVIHYDLKPQNIILERGRVKLLDFGLCKLIDPRVTRMELTSPGHGTYWYLPPECLEVDLVVGISSKVDVWSLGVILHEMVAGTRPLSQAHGNPALAIDDPQVKAICQGCLQQQVEKRWDVWQVSQQLQALAK